LSHSSIQAQLGWLDRRCGRLAGLTRDGVGVDGDGASECRRGKEQPLLEQQRDEVGGLGRGTGVAEAPAASSGVVAQQPVAFPLVIGVVDDELPRVSPGELAPPGRVDDVVLEAPDHDLRLDRGVGGTPRAKRCGSSSLSRAVNDS
jgi:hypothetical protein